MKHATLIRSSSTDEGTFGMLTLDNGRDMHTLELPWRNNAVGHSCIPPGKYLCEMVNSPSKGAVYGVQNVPGRSHVLIHAANFAGDKIMGWVSELEGCIAPADSVGVLRNPNGNAQRAGLQSKRALFDLMAWGNGDPFELEIR